MKIVLAVIIVLMLAIGIVYIIPTCVNSHKEMVGHPAWTQFIWAGKVLVPIYHEQETTLDDICDEYSG